MADDIPNCEPSTSCFPQNDYHLNVPLFVLDSIRNFQDHPNYACGVTEADIINMLDRHEFACGDTTAQVKNALRELCSSGFVQLINQGYRTLGPFASLALARNPRQYNIAWDRLSQTQNLSTISLDSSSSSSSENN